MQRHPAEQNTSRGKIVIVSDRTTLLDARLPSSDKGACVSTNKPGGRSSIDHADDGRRFCAAMRRLGIALRYESNQLLRSLYWGDLSTKRTNGQADAAHCKRSCLCGGAGFHAFRARVERNMHRNIRALALAALGQD